MNNFEKSVLINCPVKKVFEFHSDTNNLAKITPDFIKVKILEIDLPLRLNSLIKLSIIQFGILKSNWEIKLTEFVPDILITDTQFKGPFKIWIHSHCFDVKGENGDQTLMTDKINYELPFGALGEFADILFIRKMIEKQFEFRHKETKEILENDN